MRRKLLSVALALSFIIPTLSKSAKAETYGYDIPAMTVGGNVVRLGSVVPDCGSPSAKSEGSVLINTYTGEIAFELPDFVETSSTSSTEYGYYRSRLFIDKRSGVTVEFGEHVNQSPVGNVTPIVPGTTVWHSVNVESGQGPSIYEMKFDTSNAVDDVYYGSIMGCSTTKLSKLKSAKDGIPTTHTWSFVVITRQTLLDAGVPESLLPDPDPKEKLSQTLTLQLKHMDVYATTFEYPTSPSVVCTGANTTVTYSTSNSNVMDIVDGTTTTCTRGVGTTAITATAEETTGYKSATATLNVTVTKGNLKVNTAPSAGALNYGQTLTSSTLTGGETVNCVNNSVAGSFSWKTPSTCPENGKVYVVKFTPTDTTNYNY